MAIAGYHSIGLFVGEGRRVGTHEEGALYARGAGGFGRGWRWGTRTGREDVIRRRAMVVGLVEGNGQYIHSTHNQAPL